MKNNIILESLAMDLKRVALGLHRGSISVANRFIQEALARKKEILRNSVDKYIVKLLDKMEKSLRGRDSQKKAEDALMYSILFQNAAIEKNNPTV